MSLVFDLLSSINNPNQQGSVAQLEGVMGALQKIAASQGMDANQMQSVVSALGSGLGPMLKQQQTLPGLDGLIGQIANAAGGTGLTNLIPPQMQQQLVQFVSQKTGLDAGMLQSMLPSLIPAVLGFLNMGASTPGNRGENPLLSAFLKGDQGGGNDLGTVMKFASRFLNPPT